MLGVTGRTGAGKSTLAMLAAAFIPRVVRATVGGDARVSGTDVTTATAASVAGQVGIVFSTPANQLSSSKLTVREELSFGLENLGVPRDEMDERIDAVLADLAIAHLADREPFALSGGEQQRVAIASIVAMGTRALVLDEPTAQLDPEGTAEVVSLLRKLAGLGVAVLCTEHDPMVLRSVDECLVLDRGRVAAMDLPGAVLGQRILGPLGLPTPTVVALAEAVGLDAPMAFDEERIAAALAQSESIPQPPALTWKNEWRPARNARAPGIAIEGLVHRYPNGVEALTGVNLTFDPGETVAIVGQNGSGKTTLVKHLNGLLRPTEGRLVIDETETTDQPIHVLAATIGFVFQNPDDQLFERSVEREVAFGPRSLGFEADLVTQLVDDAILASGLEDARRHNPYDLDISRRKLVGLASVLATEAPILVLDEPTTGQDAIGVRRVGAIVDSLAAAGRTVIAITHDMEFAARHFHRIVVMRAGRIIADGPSGEVLAWTNAALLRSTGLAPPPAARIAGRLGLSGAPADAAALLRMLGRR